MQKIIYLALLSLLAFFSCSRSGSSNPVIPTVTTSAIGTITDSTAVAGGAVTADGGAAVKSRGVQWDTTTAFSSPQQLTSGSGTGSFTATITGLAAGSGWYVRAFATNSAGTGYGDAAKFTTTVPPSDYTVSTYAGNGTNATLDGTALSASFESPSGVAVDANGVVYVCEGQVNEGHVRRIGTDGQVTTLASLGGIATDLVLDGMGNIYVLDSREIITRISPAGVATAFAGGASASPIDGLGTAAGFKGLFSAAIDNIGNLYVTDAKNIRMITPAGNVSTLPLVASSASFGGIAVDGLQNIYVADGLQIKETTAMGGVKLIATTPNTSSIVNANSGFRGMIELRLDKDGNLLGTDGMNEKIMMITPAGVVKTLAGSGNVGAMDGNGSIASFGFPAGMAIDGSGNIFVTDLTNNKIRKVVHK